MEQTFYQPNQGTLRPFSLSAGVTHHYYSCSLQRILVDFGAEEAFNRVHDKLKEHYGISLPESAPRTITLRHAAQIETIQATQRGHLDAPPTACVISETDGSMVPIVNIDAQQKDRRKKKTVCYREARLTLAHAQGSTSPIFSATFKDVDTAGDHMADCVHRVGWDATSYLHAVGDGAPWIAEQIEKQFGQRGHYLIDFYHICEYLTNAAPICDPDNTRQWVEEQRFPS
ncbi:MAG: hypothetical protein AABY34_04995 [Pseudomonadota bacterium]